MNTKIRKHLNVGKPSYAKGVVVVFLENLVLINFLKLIKDKFLVFACN